MERLQSLEVYRELLVHYKKICRRGYCNNYMAMDRVEIYLLAENIL